MTTFIMLLVGTAITAIVQIVQSKYTVSARILLLTLAVLTAVGYQIFLEFVPQATQDSVIQFVTGSMGTAVFVYEYLIRTVVKKDFPSADILRKE